MKRSLAGIWAVALVMASGGGVASATTPPGIHAAKSGGAVSCRQTSFTATGGYYSAGHFYTLSNDTVTIHVGWCYAGDAISSYRVTRTTTISPNAQLRLSRSVHLNSAASVLNVDIGGDFLSGVVNNIGFVGIVGDVTGRGGQSFTDVSGSGG
jgi:hypothetical protein